MYQSTQSKPERCFIKWGASSRLASSPYCPMQNSDEMTIEKTHPTLLVPNSRTKILKSVNHLSWEKFHGCTHQVRYKFCDQKLDQESTLISPASTLIENSPIRKAVCGKKASHEKFRNSTVL